MSSLIGTTADWYLMRASGFVALVLLTVTVCLGVANLARLVKKPAVHTVATLVHRNASLLSVVFVALHVVTALSDRYVKVPVLSTFVPGMAGYDPLWIGIGAVSVDLLIAVMVTSLLRARLRYRSWRLVHWLAYLSWPTALIHSIGSGTGTGVDTGTAWSTAIYAGCSFLFLAAVVCRLTRRRPPTPPLGPARRPSRYAASRPGPTLASAVTSRAATTAPSTVRRTL